LKKEKDKVESMNPNVGTIGLKKGFGRPAAIKNKRMTKYVRTII